MFVMKNVLIIGLGRFGRSLAKKFYEMGKYVVAVDVDEELINESKRFVTEAKIADCTKREVLEGLGIEDFDICFVCIGSNFQASLEITDQLDSLGAKFVVSKASNDIHEKFLRKNGADRTVYPEKDHAEKIAYQFSISGYDVKDYTKLSENTGICEFIVPVGWIRHSIKELNIRNKYKVNILAIKRGKSKVIIPDADTAFENIDQVIAFGELSDIEKLFGKEK